MFKSKKDFLLEKDELLRSFEHSQSNQFNDQEYFELDKTPEMCDSEDNIAENNLQSSHLP